MVIYLNMLSAYVVVAQGYWDICGSDSAITVSPHYQTPPDRDHHHPNSPSIFRGRQSHWNPNGDRPNPNQDRWNFIWTCRKDIRPLSLLLHLPHLNCTLTVVPRCLHRLRAMPSLTSVHLPPFMIVWHPSARVPLAALVWTVTQFIVMVECQLALTTTPPTVEVLCSSVALHNNSLLSLTATHPAST